MSDGVQWSLMVSSCVRQSPVVSIGVQWSPMVPGGLQQAQGPPPGVMLARIWQPLSLPLPHGSGQRRCLPSMRGRGEGWESRAHLDSWAIFLMSLLDVGVNGALLGLVWAAGVALLVGSWLFGGSLRGPGGPVVLWTPWWCSAPSALREVDLPPWAHCHSVAG